MSGRFHDYRLVLLKEFISRGLARILADLKKHGEILGGLNAPNTFTDSFHIREFPR